MQRYFFSTPIGAVKFFHDDIAHVGNHCVTEVTQAVVEPARETLGIGDA